MLPAEITLADIVNIIDKSEKHGEHHPMPHVLIKLSLAIMAFNDLEPERMTFTIVPEVDEVSTSRTSGGRNLITQLMLWGTETVNSETDVERSIGGALRRFFIDPEWVTTRLLCSSRSQSCFTQCF